VAALAEQIAAGGPLASPRSPLPKCNVHGVWDLHLLASTNACVLYVSMYVFMCMYIILNSDVQKAYVRIRYVYTYMYIYIYVYGRICVCECVYLCACVCDGVCVCEFHTLRKQVRISYFIQTGALTLKSECVGVVVGGRAFEIQKYIQIDVRISRVCTYALLKLFINPSYVFCLFSLILSCFLLLFISISFLYQSSQSRSLDIGDTHILSH